MAEQAAELEKMNYSESYGNDYYEHDMAPAQEPVLNVTDEDIQRELDEIKQLDAKKRRLESRVTGMERDLGGLLR